MSDLPGAITKQSLSAPAPIIRSTRYSLIARGRSTAPSTRPPTGANSFEKARGCIRVPEPAAAILPHIGFVFGLCRITFTILNVFDDLLQLLCTTRTGV